jgi:hypothetical protein
LRTPQVRRPAPGGEDDGRQQKQGQLSQSEYQTEILDVVNDSPAPTTLYTHLVVTSRTKDECSRMMVRFRDEVNDLVERVSALEPPSEVASLQADFVAAARQSVDRVGALQRQIAAGDVSCGQQLNDLLYGMPSSDRADRAIRKLERHGYFVYGD